MKDIRNFCIIAHIDHGKSTLADRLLDATQTVTVREQKEQLLDNMDLERERGITIKSHAIQMDYALNGEKYRLNLIDTPGHVDFSYEVSRSISACEGALLVVDAAQGIQAQTISNLYLAIEHDLEIIPVMNKIDLPSANPEEVADQIIDLIGCKREDILSVSAKSGMGVPELWRLLWTEFPPPKAMPTRPYRPSFLTLFSILSAALKPSSASKTAKSERAKRSNSWPQARPTKPMKLACFA